MCVCVRACVRVCVCGWVGVGVLGGLVKRKENKRDAGDTNDKLIQGCE